MSSKVDELTQMLGTAQSSTAEASQTVLNADSAASSAMGAARNLGAHEPIMELQVVQELIHKAIGLSQEAAGAMADATGKVRALKEQGVLFF